METWKAPFFSVKIPEDFLGTERLDKYVSSLPDGIGRSKLKSGSSKILINGRESKLSGKVKGGDKIDIYWQDNIPDDIEPQDIPLKIIFENDDVCVVNKEQGMVTHPAAGNWSGTLVNALLFHWGRKALSNVKDKGSDGLVERIRPGIVHRLDKDTSGVIITAKNRAAQEWLSLQFSSRRLCKEYIMIVRGCPPKKDGVVDTFIARDPADRKRFKAFPLDGQKKRQSFGEDAQRRCSSDPLFNGAKRAKTLYHVVSVYGDYALVRARLLTGRTHQIRVHMKFLGCPVLGDAIYSKKDPVFPDASLMLHSRLLKIRLPGQKKFHSFKAAVPPRFKDVIKALKKNALGKGK